MKVIQYFILVFIGLLVVSCSKVVDPVKKIGLGSRNINYQADEIGRQIAAIEKEQEEVVAEMMLLGNTPGGMDSWQLKRLKQIKMKKIFIKVIKMKLSKIQIKI